MTKKNKVIRTIAAVTAVALLGGGIYLLVKNDVAQKINWQDILIYAPTPMARETLDEALTGRLTARICMQARCLWTIAVQVIFLTLIA